MDGNGFFCIIAMSADPQHITVGIFNVRYDNPEDTSVKTDASRNNSWIDWTRRIITGY